MDSFLFCSVRGRWLPYPACIVVPMKRTLSLLYRFNIGFDRIRGYIRVFITPFGKQVYLLYRIYKESEPFSHREELVRII